MFAMLTSLVLMATPQMNVLTPQERSQGFNLLFDGTTTKHWHRYKGGDVPSGWKIKDGVLSISPGDGEGGDISSDDQFANFVLRFDWNISEEGNSGVYYRSSENYDAGWLSGPEFQLLDNARNGDGKNPLTTAGSAYAIYAPSKDVCHPAGEWNSASIMVRGNHVEHWMNGEKIVAYDLHSSDWKDRVSQSKFSSVQEYGLFSVGHIVLQDHGHQVSFRNIRIRRL